MVSPSSVVAGDNSLSEQQLQMFQYEPPIMPIIDKTRCSIRRVNYLTAANMVRDFHYAHVVPSIMFSTGMYVDNVLAGVVTYCNCTTEEMRQCCGKENREFVWELNRLFIHDWAGRNSESWLIAQSLKLLKRSEPKIKVVLSYADPKYGHTGVIYQATNWLYAGMSRNSKDVGEVIIDDVKYTAKTIYDKCGATTKKAILETYPHAEIVLRRQKHRYVMFLGKNQVKEEMRAALKWPILPYPKLEKSRDE